MKQGEKGFAVKKSLDVGNTIKKLVLDQTVGATVNTMLFTAVIGALKGLDGGDIVDAIKQVSRNGMDPHPGPGDSHADRVLR